MVGIGSNFMFDVLVTVNTGQARPFSILKSFIIMNSLPLSAESSMIHITTPATAGL